MMKEQPRLWDHDSLVCGTWLWIYGFVKHIYNNPLSGPNNE